MTTTTGPAAHPVRLYRPGGHLRHERQARCRGATGQGACGGEEPAAAGRDAGLALRVGS